MAGVLAILMIVAKWVFAFYVSGEEGGEFLLAVVPIVGMASSAYLPLVCFQALVDALLILALLRGNGYAATRWIGVSFVLTLVAPYLDYLIGYNTGRFVEGAVGFSLSMFADMLMVAVRGFGFLVIDAGWHGALVLLATLHNRR